MKPLHFLLSMWSWSWEQIICYLSLSLVAYIIITLCRIYFSDADLETLSASRSIPSDKSLIFKGKIVWITGASSGIGEQLAYAFATRGAKLILSARRMGVLMKVAEKCLELGAEEAESLKTDVTAPINDLSSLAAHIQRQSRFGRVDYLVNAAGRRQHSLVVPPAGDASSIQSEDRNILELNTLAAISVTKAVLPIFLKQKEGGVVVTISSAAGKVGSPISATYSASKHAVLGFMDSARMELSSRNVRFVNLCPGPIQAASFNASGEKPSGSDLDGSTRLPMDRCIELMCAAIWAELEESWIAPQPVLSFIYLGQYARWLYYFLGRSIGKKRVQAFEKDGSRGYGHVSNVFNVLRGDLKGE